ncbi:MAG: type II toxin-antitoxin system VapC family toxin [Casimicrobium sp.]
MVCVDVERAFGDCTRRNRERSALRGAVHERAIDLEAILMSSELKTQHGDPFDRLLYAQAKHGKLKLLTVDEKIPKFGTAVVRAA